MNAGDWKRIEEELRNPYGSGAELRADGHLLHLRVMREKGLKFTIGVFVDGSIKGAHTFADSEIGAKFYRKKLTPMFGPASIRKMQKENGKRFAAMMVKKYPPTHYFSPSWPTVASLRRHLTKTCTSIELISAGYVPKAAPEAGP